MHVQYLHEVVTGIADNQAEVAFSCKVHTCSDLVLRRRHNDIAAIEAP